MEQVKALTGVIHNDTVHKAGHIFKVPEDMDLEMARKLMAKDIVTDAIEVLDETEVELTETEAAQVDDPDTDGSDEAETIVITPDADGSDDEPDGGETEEETTSEATDTDAPGDEPVDIDTLTKAEIKEELKARGIEYTKRETKESLLEKLRAAALTEADSEPVDGEE